MSSSAETGELVNGAVLGEPGFLGGSRSVLLIENPEPPDIGGWVDLPDLELDEDFTIEAWYRFCGEFIWFQDALVGQGEEGPDINWAELHARLWTGDSDVLVSANLVGSAGWHHLAITRGDGELVMYEDGVQTATGSYSDPFPIKAIGHGNGGTFGGWLDEVAFYDHALTAEQILEHAAFGQ